MCHCSQRRVIVSVQAVKALEESVGAALGTLAVPAVHSCPEETRGPVLPGPDPSQWLWLEPWLGKGPTSPCKPWAQGWGSAAGPACTWPTGSATAPFGLSPCGRFPEIPAPPRAARVNAISPAPVMLR